MKLLLTITTILTLTSVGAASALTPAYKAKYCYPTGTYWAKQVSKYPAYYAANNAYYVSHYGAATQYCN